MLKHDVDLAATVEFPRSPIFDLAADATSAGQRVELVAGQAPELSAEVAGVLHQRLRAAAAVLLVSLTVMGGYSLYMLMQYSYSPRQIAVLCATEVILIAVVSRLVPQRRLSLALLRTTELILFGTFSLFLAHLQFESARYALAHGRPEEVTAINFRVAQYWIMLVMAYTIFIPNTWQRAAEVLAAITISPLIVMVLERLMYPEFAPYLSINHFVLPMLTLVLVWGTGAFGAHTINRLRRSAFEARQFGQYHLLKHLGSGAMGEVFLAEHRLLKRACAIKVIRPDKAANPNVTQQFEREVQATAKLTHWNTVEVFDYGHTDDGTFYYVMEYLPGMSLEDLVLRFGPLAPERAWHFLAQVCSALEEAHAIGIVHRDIKPANIFATVRGGQHDVAKLLDFGLVLHCAENSAGDSGGKIAGTPLYMAPEQWNGTGPIDARTDIYSLGAVGYFLLTGRPPRTGHRLNDLMAAVDAQPILPLSSVNLDVDADLDRVLMRCLAKHAHHRFSTAEELSAALATCAVAGKWDSARAKQCWQDADAGR